MKILKKISLVYTLQVFAVILLLGYAVASPVTKTKEDESGLPSEYNKQPVNKTDTDSVITGNTNTIWNYSAKTR